MSEDVTVDKKVIDDAEKEVLESSKKKEEEIKSNIEAKLRKEMEDKKRADEQANHLKKLEEENKTMQKMLQEEREKTQRELEELKSKIGSSRAIHIQPNQPKPSLDLDNEEILREIQRNSEEAFIEKYNLPKQWRGR